MQKEILRIVTTGPESSGKTVMASALAEALGVMWSPEFARYYVAHMGRPYQRADLRSIGAGQKQWEEWHARQTTVSGDQKILLLDTDWTVLQIWEQYRFQSGDEYEWRKGYGKVEIADLYLLCAPDFSWQPDPLREHPDERDILFDLYEKLLQAHGAHFVTLSGTHDARLQSALAAIRKLL